MPSLEITEFLSYIEQLTVATRSGSVEWTRVNPTTFTWDTIKPTPARLSLQRVDRRDRVVKAGRPMVITSKHYVFQAVDPEEGLQKLSISGADDPDVNQKLEALYDAISSGLSRKGLDFLKSLLPS